MPKTCEYHLKMSFSEPKASSRSISGSAELIQLPSFATCISL